MPIEAYDARAYSELRRRVPGAKDAHSALPPGHVLHEYRIEQVLGVGGFGVTYLARDTVLGHTVAIKEYLPADLAARDGTTGAIHPRSKRHGEDYGNGLTRFLLEARTLAGFHHHNIVGVHRFFEANNSAYMVMAYEQGENLNTWLSRRLLRGGGTPHEALLVGMFAPLLRGLDKVHQAGFLHRDIKPANIFARDADGSLVLLDFGAARQAGGTTATEDLTGIVTPGYAPFEQYHSHGRHGPWSDLYAVGGVLYWFVAGRRPIEAAARAQNDPQQPALEAGAGRYSEEFLAAIDWALAVEEGERPQSVSELLPALTGEMPVSRGRPAAPRAEPPAPAGPPTIPRLFASLEKTDRHAAAVILNAEPALVMGVEQNIESAAPRGPLAPKPAGPTTVTRAEQVTVIAGGDDAAAGTAGRRWWPDWLGSPLLWCVMLCLLVLAGAGLVALQGP